MSVVTALAATSALLLTSFTGVAVASPTAATAAPAPVTHQGPHPVLDNAGRVVASTKLAQANRNEATLERLRTAHAHRPSPTRGAHHATKPSTQVHLPAVLAQRKLNRVGYLPLVGTQPPTARTLHAYAKTLHSSATTTHGAGRAVQGRILSAALTAAPADTTATTGGISGTVTDSASGSPIEGVCVTAYGEFGTQAPDSCTDATGAYSVTGLEPGSYFVQAEDHVASHITNGIPNVNVTTGADTANVDIAMVQGGSIAGHVTDAANNPLKDICVNLDNGDEFWPAGGCTDANGDFQTTGAPPASYAVNFSDNSGYYESQWYSGKTVYTDADKVDVTVGNVATGIDASMVRGGSISGTLSGSDGSIPVGVCGHVDDAFQQWAGEVLCSDSSGHYTTTSLASGTYKIQFTDSTGTYLNRWYGNTTNEADATGVAVTHGVDTSGIDVTLPLAGHITGTVVDAADGTTPLSDVCVETDSDNAEDACTGPDGHYDIGGLETGSYHLSFYDDSAAGYLTRNYHDVDPTAGTGDAVAVTQGQTSAVQTEHLVLGGRISGQVVNDASTPLADICVDTQEGDGSYTCTDDSGNYTIVGLPTGSYHLEFEDDSGTGYLSRHYHDVDAATGAGDSLAVTVSTTTTALTEHLVLGGTITGRLTAAVGGAPLPADIEVYDANNPGADPVSETASNDTGAYTVRGLESGSYKLLFHPYNGYLAVWYGDATTEADAATVAVTRGATTAGIDAAAHAGGIITGTVTAAATGLPISGICVDATSTTDDAEGEDCSAADGTYSINGLETGDYTVTFDGAWEGYVTQAVDAPVHAAIDTTTSSVDGQLVLGGTIAGVITDAAGDPIVSPDNGDGCASASDADGAPVGAAHCADATGHYTITGLPAGDYTVEFDAVSYITEYYNDVVDPALASPVHVELGATTASIDASLALGGDIAGTVTDAATGQPPASPWSLQVAVYDGGGNAVGWSDVDGDGHYDVTGLASGAYTVEFTDNDGEFLTQWYDGASTQASATPVNVTQGTTTANIDAALSDGGSISGHVTETSGQPLADVCVQAFLPSDTTSSIRSACSDSSGAYRIGGLATGTYLVEFVPESGPYFPQWANAKPDSASADFISVAFGANTGGVDAVLAQGASFSGTVTDKATGDPIADVCIETTGPDGSYLGIPSTCSDDTGHYSTVGLAPGSYTFGFNDWGSDYVEQWWDNAATPGSATVVTFTGTEQKTGNDVRLVTGGHISGSVTDGNDNGVGSWVDFYDTTTNTSVTATGVTDGDGSYTSPALLPGSYKVLFSAWNDGRQQWYDGKTDIGSATVVDVTAGVTTPGVDGLFTGATGSISGTVTDAATGQPLSGLCVQADPVAGGSSSEGCTDESGAYTITGVPVGDYSVSFWEFNEPYLSGSYTAGGTSPATVTVADSATTSGVDLALTRGATVSGTITDAASGQPLPNVCADIVPAGTTANTSNDSGTCSDSDGHYQTRGVVAGDYQVVFTNNGGRYLTQWYDASADQSGARTLSLASGADRNAVDAAMTLGAAVSGTVTDAATADPISGVCITFHDAATNVVDSLGGCTDSRGHYAAVVPAGSYKVQFSDGSGAHVDQWWDNKPDAASADPLTVAAGDARSTVNAAMSAPSASTGSVSGVVEDASSNPVQDASLTLCNTSTQACSSTTSDSSGAYAFTGKPAATYDLTAYPSANSGLNWGHTTVNVVAGQATLQDLMLTASAPLTAAAGVSVNGVSTGTPTAFWTESTALTADGCAGGTATYSVTDASGSIISSGPLVEGTPGHYAGSMPALYPNRGTMTVTIAMTCPNAGDDKTDAFTMYIDPSGTIKDTAGHAIPRATVTLLQSATQNGTYTPVPNGSAVMSPANRTNPDTTDSTGHYGWDVVAGWYKVSAQKSDCYAPNTYSAAANTVITSVTSAAEQIPPAVTNLDLTLDCTNIAPVAAFTQSSTSGRAGVSVHFDASGSKDANGSVASYSWNFGDGTSGAGVSADHTYASPGNFTPTLTVTDDQGLATPKQGAVIAIGDVPAQVGGISATSGVHQVALSWTAPVANNSPITGYTVDVSPGGQHIVTTTPSAVVTGLTGNSSYTFTVKAVNAYGASPASTVDGAAAAVGKAPTVTITSAPAGYSTQRSTSVAFGVTVDPSVSVAGVTCSIDGAAASPCTSPTAMSGLANGSHSIAITARDSDGNVGSASRQWVVDATAPTAAQTAPTSLTSLGPIAVRWAGADASGIASYDVRYTKAAWNGKPGAPVVWKSTTTSTAATFVGTAGYEYCFSTRARDAAGNVSGWSAPKCSALPLDDRGLAASAGWKKVSLKGAFNRTVMQATAARKTLTRKGAAVGRAVLLVTTGKRFGSVVVLYNGKIVKKVSLAATRTHNKVAIALPTVRKARTTVVIKTTTARKVQIDGLLLARV